MITESRPVRDPFYRLEKHGEFSGTLRAVADVRLGQVYGGAIRDHAPRSHAEGDSEREESQGSERFGELSRTFNGLFF
ncbi:hypothetical protein TNCT_577481 [Trichonephila clavata]|uniref:Uncharacterized protein n=1 Tax=Trichonephila clavata TaxID=2740835 RepID=A0A8X6LI68_TRICU|nr:hypothetical protein TNCT_577481 [Trichonephila clavata]